MPSLSYACGKDTFDWKDQEDWREINLMLGVTSVCEVLGPELMNA